MEVKASVWVVAGSGRVRVPVSFLSRAQRLSAAALSERDLVRPQFCRGPNSRIHSLNSVDVYSLP